MSKSILEENAPMLDWALYYAGLGLSVFPIQTRTKEKFYRYDEFKGRPTKKYPEGTPYSWAAQASSDPDRVRRFWTDHPKANIGIACGMRSGGLYVLDLDPEHIETDPATGAEHIVTDGWERLHKWERDTGHRIPTDTWTVKTGRGGSHLLYRGSKDQFPTGSGGDADIFKDDSGCDTRGDGRYIVAPPSIHPNGRRYEWETAPGDCQILNVGADVSAYWCGASRTSGTGADARKEPFHQKEVVTAARHDYLKSYIGRRIHDTRAAWSEAEYEYLLRQENERVCCPPIGQGPGDSPDEFETTVLPMVHNFVEKERTERARSEFSGEDTCEEPADPAAALSALKTVADVEEEAVKWLIPFFLPEGAITAMGGDGGVGKTMTWCAIAAAISTGESCFLDEVAAEVDLLPIRKREPGKVIFFSSEDSVSKVLRRRLRDMGADLSMIRFMEPSNEEFQHIKFDSPELKAIIEAEKPKLVIFDPLQSFIPEKTDMSRRNAMRAALNPLIGLAEKNDCAVLIAMHTNKRMGGAAGRNRLSDSSDIWDIVRSVWLLGRDRTAAEPTFYLSQEKGNYGMSRLTALYDTDGGKINFLGTTEKHDADFVMDNERRRASGTSSVRAECKDVIRNILEENGEMDVGAIDDVLTNVHGFSKNAIRRAKADLKAAEEIRLWNTGGPDGKKWHIALKTAFGFS